MVWKIQNQQNQQTLQVQQELERLVQVQCNLTQLRLLQAGQELEVILPEVTNNKKGALKVAPFLFTNYYTFPLAHPHRFVRDYAE